MNQRNMSITLLGLMSIFAIASAAKAQDYLPLLKRTTTINTAQTVKLWNTVPVEKAIPHSNGGTMTAYHYSTGSTTPHPIVFLLHGCSGAFSYSNPIKGISSIYKKRANRLVDQGYDVLLIDSFSFRQADQNQCENGEGGTSEVTERPWDVVAAYNYLPQLAGVDSNQVLLMGWSHGASTVLSTLQKNYLPLPQNAIKAAVAYYPGCGLYSAFGGINNSTWVPNAPLLILHAGNDDLYTSGYCEQRIENAELLGANLQNGNPIDMVVYAGAEHSFDYAYSVSASWTQDDVDARNQGIIEWTDFYTDWLN